MGQRTGGALLLFNSSISICVTILYLWVEFHHEYTYFLHLSFTEGIFNAGEVEVFFDFKLAIKLEVYSAT